MNKELNIRPETMKLLEGSIGEKLLDFGCGKHVWDMTQKHKQQK